MSKGKSDETHLEKPKELGGIQRAGLALRLEQVQRIGTDHAQYFLIHRWKNLRRVRGKMLVWLAAVAVLVAIGAWQIQAQEKLYSHQAAVEGGTYIEGSVGNVSTLNPIFAADTAEQSLSKLLFSGLLSSDPEGNISGDLAQSWSLSDEGRVTTVTLRDNLRWSDGTPITAKDVVFTIDTIQAPEVRSPLASSWEGVEVEAVDERTVKFSLDAPFVPFLRSLSVGILPEHVLSSVPLEQMRNAVFSSQPNVTSGPFEYRGIVKGRGGENAQTDVYLRRNNDYHLGAAKMERFTMRVYQDKDALVDAMQNQEIMAANDIPTNSVDYFKSQKQVEVTRKPLFSGVFAFFNTSKPPFNDEQVRKALALGTNLDEITSAVGDVSPMQGPLLPGQLGYKDSLRQSTGDVDSAKALLEKEGWKLGEDGIRQKKKQPLRLEIVALNSGEFGTVAQALQQQWEQLGVDVEVNLLEAGDFQQNALTPHAYDVLVYQLGLGRDSDSYAFWHSSQARVGRLNLSEYESERADRALEAGRSVVNSQLRDIKYSDFIETWIQDVPAVALYQPNLYYVQLKDSHSVQPGPIGDSQERFNNVRYWTAETGRVYKTQ